MIMRERILVVDDNEYTADSFARLLSMFGGEATAVYSGQQAVEQAGAIRPDMALIDIGMPDMDGYEAAVRIRERCGNAPIILVAVTGWARDEEKRHARECGFDLHVAKPVDLATLKQLLALLNHSSANAEPAAS